MVNPSLLDYFQIQIPTTTSRPHPSSFSEFRFLTPSVKPPIFGQGPPAQSARDERRCGKAMTVYSHVRSEAPYSQYHSHVTNPYENPDYALTREAALRRKLDRRSVTPPVRPSQGERTVSYATGEALRYSLPDEKKGMKKVSTYTDHLFGGRLIDYDEHEDPYHSDDLPQEPVHRDYWRRPVYGDDRIVTDEEFIPPAAPCTTGRRRVPPITVGSPLLREEHSPQSGRGRESSPRKVTLSDSDEPYNVNSGSLRPLSQSRRKFISEPEAIRRSRSAVPLWFAMEDEEIDRKMANTTLHQPRGRLVNPRHLAVHNRIFRGSEERNLWFGEGDLQMKENLSTSASTAKPNASVINNTTLSNKVALQEKLVELKNQERELIDLLRNQGY